MSKSDHQNIQSLNERDIAPDDDLIGIVSSSSIPSNNVDMQEYDDASAISNGIGKKK